jgi:hypothetical protein
MQKKENFYLFQFSFRIKQISTRSMYTSRKKLSMGIVSGEGEDVSM